MRATTPLDQLEAMGSYDLAQPRHRIGDEVSRNCLTPYYRKKVLRHELKETRRIVEKLKKNGYCDEPPKGKLNPHNKGRIVAMMTAFDKAERLEIAGISPVNALVVDNVANHCYLRAGQSHGGVYWEYHLLFRYTDEQGRKLAFIPGISLVSEGHLQLVPATTPEATKAQDAQQLTT